MTKLHAAYKGLLDQANGILAQAGEAGMTAEQSGQFNTLIQQAESLKGQIEAADKMAKLQEWGSQSTGSAVKAGFAREAMPGEGEIDGVTADASGELYSTKGVGEQKLAALKSGAYKDAFNDYIRSTGLGRAMKGDAMKVLNEGSDTSGGFWLPPDYRAELIKKVMAMTVIRPNASVYTTGTDSITFPKVTYTTDNKYTAGTRFSWQESSPLSADISESTNPVAGQVRIPVHSATAAVILTREQMEDNSFDLLGYISLILSEAYAGGEEDAFINGTGVGQPQGILAHANATVATGSGGMYVPSGYSAAVAWGTTTSGSSGAPTTGIIAMDSYLPPQYEANAKWVANKATLAALRVVADSQARPVWNINDQWPNFANGQSMSLLGYPILKSQWMPDIGANTYPMLLGDLRGYYIVDRVGLSIEVLREVRALRGEVVVYARKRVGGQLVHDWRVKDLKCAAS